MFAGAEDEVDGEAAWALDAGGARYQARASTQSLASLGGFHVAAKHFPLPELDSWTASEEIGRFARNERPASSASLGDAGDEPSRFGHTWTHLGSATPVS